MKLFNPYNNQIFIELVNYINSNMMGNGGITKESFIRDFLQDRLHLPKDSINALSNEFMGKNGVKNINIFHEDENGEFVSILNREDILPVRFNKAELSWLYYVLNCDESALFINETYKDELLDSIRKHDIIELAQYFWKKENQKVVSKEIAACITDVVFYSIKTRRTVVFNDEFYIIYRVEYDTISREYRLLLYPVRKKNKINEKDDIIFFSLGKRDFLSIGTPIDADIDYLTYNEYLQLADKRLKSHLVEKPLELLVIASTSQEGKKVLTKADDRCAYLFSAYDTTAYLDNDDNIVFSIRYYDFQKYEVFDNILSLGKYVKVLAPADVKEEIVSLIRVHYEMYNL